MTLHGFLLLPDKTTAEETTSYTKDGKVIEMPESIARLQRWGMWVDGGGYADGKAIGQADFGADYRVLPNWLVGASGRYDWGHGHFGQGGVYSTMAFKSAWLTVGGLFGPSSITAYGEAGYALKLAQRWLTGPVYAFQFDRFWHDTGFGTGSLVQNRVGWWAAYPVGRLIPQAQIMYQNSSDDNDPQRNNALWFGAGASLGLSEHWSVYSFYSFEGNGNYQVSQGQFGLRLSF